MVKKIGMPEALLTESGLEKSEVMMSLNRESCQLMKAGRSSFPAFSTSSRS